MVLCPSASGPPTNRFYSGYSTSSYPAVHGGGVTSVRDEPDSMANGIFGEASSVQISMILDGTSETFLVGERLLTETGNNGAIWMRSINRAGDAGDGSAVAGVCDRRVSINDLTHPDAFSSNHEGGAFFVMADGAVRFVSETIEPLVYDESATIDGDRSRAAADN